MIAKASPGRARGDVEIPDEISADIPTPVKLEKPGRIIGHCPEQLGEGVEIDGVSCWKFTALPDQASTHDFLLLLFIIDLDPLYVLNAVVPQEDGGVKHIMRFTQIRRILETNFIQEIRQSNGNFGVVSIGRITAKTYFRELEKLFVGDRCLVKRLDANADPVGDYTELLPTDFPTFPDRPSRVSAKAEVLDIQSNLTPEEAIRLVSADDYTQGLILNFPKWEEEGGELFVKDDEAIGPEVEQPSSPGDIRHLTLDDLGNLSDDEIGRGFVSIGSEAAETASVMAPAAIKPRPPGIHIEFVRHPGNPGHVAALFWFKPVEGRSKFLFGDWCTQVSFRTFIERIIEKKKKSWFGSRKKITTIRKELIVDGILCKPMP